MMTRSLFRWGRNVFSFVRDEAVRARNVKLPTVTRLTISLFFATALIPHAAQAGSDDTASVTRKGVILFDPEQRRAELRQMREEDRAQFCMAGPDSLVSHKVKTHLKTPKQGGTDSRAEPFLWSIMNATAQYFAFGDETSLDIVRANFRRWARGGGLTKLRDSQSNVYYTLNRALLPIIVNWSLVRRDTAIPKSERDQVDGWIDRIFTLHENRDRHIGEDSIVLRNNHQLLHDSVDMAYGILKASDKTFRRGLSGYREALATMREDGSLPLETGRGARALWYQRHAIASLMAMHVMAKMQGIDVRREEKQLFQAIEFLFDAIANNEVVAPYAKEDFNSGTSRDWRNQDVSFLVQRGHGRHYMAWIETYQALSGRGATQPVLRAVMTPDGQSIRPMIDEYSGGNMTCFFATP